MQNAKQQNATQQTNVVKQTSGGDLANLISQDSDLGHDNVTDNDVTLPRLKLLASTSPECQPGSSDYIDSARPTMFLNSVTKSLYDGSQGLFVVPCYYKLTYKEWDMNNTSSGPIAEYPGDHDIKHQTTRQGSKDVLPNGNVLEANGEHYILILDENFNVAEKAVVYMSKTQFKKSKQWNAMIMNMRKEINGKKTEMPRWSQIYKMSSIMERNKTYSWPGFVINHHGDVSADVYKIGKQFYETIKKGDIKVQSEAQATASTENVAGDKPPF